MKDRRREMIPIEKIKVINSRTRDETQFALNVQSIEAIGQIKDIRVNDKFLTMMGSISSIICGEGAPHCPETPLAKPKFSAAEIYYRKHPVLPYLSRWWRICRSRPGTAT